MLIECPSCARRYTIAPAALDADGRDVVCTRCEARWFVAVETVMATGQALIAPVISAAASSERSRPPRQHERHGAAGGRAAGRRTLPRFAPSLALGAALLCATSAAIAARVPLVRHVPQLSRVFAAVALPTNVRGLSLAGVETRRDVNGREAYLDIDGSISNLRAGVTPLPPLRLTVVGADGQPLYGWTEKPPKPRLAAGEQVAFHARLAAPPAAGRAIVVRFAAAADENR